MKGRDTRWDKRTQAREREWTSEKLSKGCLGFVNRHLSILVTDAYKSSVSHQVLKRKDSYSEDLCYCQSQASMNTDSVHSPISVTQ